MVLWSCIWSWVTSVVLFCCREILWLVLSGKGVIGCCLDSWGVRVLYSWSFVIGYVLLKVRDIVEIKFVVKFSSFFNLLLIMILFCFGANVCRCYVSFFISDAFFEVLVWDEENIVRLLVLVQRRFFLLIKFGILRILLATLLLWLSWLGNIEVEIVVYTCSGGFLGKLVVIWYTFLVNIGGLLRESGCMLLIVGDLGFTD